MTIKTLAEKAQEAFGETPTWVGARPVTLMGKGVTVWDGTVQEFELANSAKGARCYAWTSATDTGAERVRVVEVSVA